MGLPSQGIAKGDITPMSDLTSCQQASWGQRAAPTTLAGLQEIAGTAQWQPPSVTRVAYHALYLSRSQLPWDQLTRHGIYHQVENLQSSGAQEGLLLIRPKDNRACPLLVVQG